ncbi:MAG: L,D-transpeptidase [Aggregatilineales bacterium]
MKYRVLPLFIVIFGVLLALPISAQDSNQTLPTVYDPAVCEGSSELDALTADCLAMIEAFPLPPFEAIPQDRTTLSTYSFWRVGPDAVNTYDAPGGGINGQIAAGFNYVNAIDTSVDGWLQIEGGSWINRDNTSYNPPSFYSGVILEGWQDHPFAWVLDLSQIFVSEVPGGPSSQATGRFLRRYELVNIFDTAVDAEGWRWYMIGPNQWVKQTFVAKVQPTERPEGVSGHWVAIDLYEQTLIAYEDDTPVFATLIASGLPTTETNEGVFEVWARLDVDAMSGATGAPNAYALQSVPWVMYFDDSISLHGTYWHDLFGYRQSRGCVNLTISDARYVYQWFLEAEPQVASQSAPELTVTPSSIFNPTRGQEQTTPTATQGTGEIVNYVYVYSSGEYGGGVVRGS